MSQILGNPTHGRGLVCKIYKKLNTLHMEKQTTQFIGNGMKLSKEETQIASKSFKNVQ